VMRFNKIALENQRVFRNECGKIYSDHAARGVLKSGYTVKRCYEQFELSESQTIDECLELVSKLTAKPNKRRSRLLSHLQDIVRQHSKIRNDQLIEKLDQMAVLSGYDGHAAAERLFNQMLARLKDRIDKYDEGLTAPAVEDWHVRHPVLIRVLPALIVASIVGLFSLIFGVVDFSKLFG